jgi:SHS2 domain-containing protein
MPYKISDAYTSADVGLIASGETLEQLFADSAAGLMEIMVEPEGLRESRNLALEIEGNSLD